jgi:hypothetical protein
MRSDEVARQIQLANVKSAGREGLRIAVGLEAFKLGLEASIRLYGPAHTHHDEPLKIIAGQARKAADAFIAEIMG